MRLVHHWSQDEALVHGGRRRRFQAPDGRTVAVVITLPGTLARWFWENEHGDEPTMALAMAAVSDRVGATTGAYREARNLYMGRGVTA